MATPEPAAKNPGDVVDEADEEIRRFEAWFVKPRPEGLGESSLGRFERAILKTYLVHSKLGKF